MADFVEGLDWVERSDLLGRVWRFRRADGAVFADRARLISDGSVHGIDSEFEVLWRFEGGLFSFHTRDGVMTSLFATGRRTAAGGLVLQGDFVLAPELAVRLVLDSEPVAPVVSSRRMHMLMGLGETGDTLLVLVNSLGRPFDGFDR